MWIENQLYFVGRVYHGWSNQVIWKFGLFTWTFKWFNLQHESIGLWCFSVNSSNIETIQWNGNGTTTPQRHRFYDDVYLFSMCVDGTILYISHTYVIPTLSSMSDFFHYWTHIVQCTQPHWPQSLSNLVFQFEYTTKFCVLLRFDFVMKKIIFVAIACNLFRYIKCSREKRISTTLLQYHLRSIPIKSIRIYRNVESIHCLHHNNRARST